MCYRPIRIYNRKIEFNPNFDKCYFDVPCGKCCECSNSRVTSWSLRNYYEFLNCKDKKGSVFNITLTYNDKNLPKQFGIPTFCKSDIQKFLKLLRKWLVKDGLIKDGELRYFLTSEFGKLHARPHYHVIFYILRPINGYVFYKYVQKYWNRGFVGYGKLGIEVLDFHALQYCCKYITKDSSYQKVIDNVKKKYQELTEDKDLVNFDSFFKDFRQFHLESKGFGKCMLKYVTEKELFLGRVLSPFKTGSDDSLPVPFYIMRKVFYDEVKKEDGTIRYVLNEKGITRKLKSLSDSILNDTNNLIKLSQYEDDVDLLNELQCESVKSFFDEMDITLKTLGLPRYSVFIYKYVYRDRIITDISNNFHLDYAKYLYRFNEPNFLLPMQYIAKYHDIKDFAKDVCNYEGIFRIFEKFLGKLQAFKRYDAYKTQLRIIQDYNIKQSQVALVNGSKPVYKDLPDKRDFFTYLLT